MIIQFGVGHAVVGKFEKQETMLGPTLRSIQAATIRRWGTTKGIGELENGPLKETNLDPIPSGIEIPMSSLVGVWRLSDVGVEKFNNYLAKEVPARILDAF
jgi:hypothetical protein